MREVAVNQDVVGMVSVLVLGQITELGKGNRDHHDFFQHSNENQSICKANVFTFFYLVTTNDFRINFLPSESFQTETKKNHIWIK